jgi:serine phosphatase RsbU (regulator of sigma subunit)
VNQPSEGLGDSLEARNFLEIVSTLKVSAGHPPEVGGMEIAGVSLPRRGPVGGDHILYINFRERFDLPRRIEEAEARGATTVAQELRRCAHRGGILLADISGHRTTDALVAAMLHQAFLLGTYYELDRFGRITTQLFEHLNQRFWETTAVSRYFTMIYGEISDEGKFRFICAGHPHPLVYSREFRSFVAVPKEHLASFPPVGLVPSGEGFAERGATSSLGTKSRYTVNRIDLLAPGDSVILYTDGLSDLSSGNYISERLLGLMRETADLPAREIADRIRTDVLQSPDREDDISFVIIKRTAS